MNKNCCIIAGLVFFAACSCQRETLSEPEAASPVMAIGEALQQYGEQVMQNKEGALLAIDPATGAILAGVFTTDPVDSLKVIELAKKCQSEGFPKVSPEELEQMWWDVNHYSDEFINQLLPMDDFLRWKNYWYTSEWTKIENPPVHLPEGWFFQRIIGETTLFISGEIIDAFREAVRQFRSELEQMYFTGYDIYRNFPYVIEKALSLKQSKE